MFNENLSMNYLEQENQDLAELLAASLEQNNILLDLQEKTMDLVQKERDYWFNQVNKRSEN